MPSSDCRPFSLRSYFRISHSLGVPQTVNSVDSFAELRPSAENWSAGNSNSDHSPPTLQSPPSCLHRIAHIASAMNPTYERPRRIIRAPPRPDEPRSYAEVVRAPRSPSTRSSTPPTEDNVESVIEQQQDTVSDSAMRKSMPLFFVTAPHALPCRSSQKSLATCIPFSNSNQPPSSSPHKPLGTSSP